MYNILLTLSPYIIPSPPNVDLADICRSPSLDVSCMWKKQSTESMHAHKLGPMKVLPKAYGNICSKKRIIKKNTLNYQCWSVQDIPPNVRPKYFYRHRQQKPLTWLDFLWYGNHTATLLQVTNHWSFFTWTKR